MTAFAEGLWETLKSGTPFLAPQILLTSGQRPEQMWNGDMLPLARAQILTQADFLKPAKWSVQNSRTEETGQPNADIKFVKDNTVGAAAMAWNAVQSKRRAPPPPATFSAAASSSSPPQ